MITATLKSIARPPYHAMQAAIRGAKGYRAWRAVQHDLMRRVPQLNMQVSDRDEMLLDLIRSSGSRYQGLASYFQTGEMLYNDLRAAAWRNDKPLEHAGSVLDFACGYGRVTRWLAAYHGPRGVWVSDIDRDAVEFARRTFGVQGVTSTYCAADFPPWTADVIFVASLFSHLSIDHWKPWAAKLLSMLRPDGLLVFSTLGMQIHESRPERIKRLFREVTPGFVYNGTNETGGRLAGEYYGSTYVTEDWVRKAIGEVGGKVVEYTPQGLAGYQDLYVARVR